MKHGTKHIDDLFREKLGDYAETPPPGAWNELDTRLDVLTPPAPHAPFHWLGHVGMVSVIAVLGVSVLSRFVNDKAGISSETSRENMTRTEVGATTMPTTSQQTGSSEVSVPEPVGGSESMNATREVASGGAEPDGSGNMPSASKGIVGGYAGKNSKRHKSVVRLMTRNNTSTGSNAEKTGPGAEESSSEISIYNSSKQSQSIDNQIENNGRKISDAPRSKAPVVSAKPAGKSIPDVLGAAKEKANVDFPRWAAGVKVGYERGADNIAAKKLAVAPYLQYNISSRLAVMTQPAVKMANSQVRTVSSRSYYAPKDDGTVTSVQNYVEPRAEGGVVDTYYFSRFRYTRSHDSIVKNETIGGRYLEFELPILLRYSIAKNVSVYGGMNMVFSQLSGVKQNTYTKTLTKTADSLMSSRSVAPSPVAVGEVITYDGTPITEYDGPLYPSSQVNRLRLGAMVGVTYEYSGRWLLDALVQQNPAPKDMRGAHNINAPLSSTYFRLSVGYKLTK